MRLVHEQGFVIRRQLKALGIRNGDSVEIEGVFGVTPMYPGPDLCFCPGAIRITDSRKGWMLQRLYRLPESLEITNDDDQDLVWALAGFQGMAYMRIRIDCRNNVIGLTIDRDSLRLFPVATLPLEKLPEIPTGPNVAIPLFENDEERCVRSKDGHGIALSILSNIGNNVRQFEPDEGNDLMEEHEKVEERDLVGV